MTWEPCPGCKAPVWTEPDGTVIGLSAKVHVCFGPLPEVMECYCGALVWVRDGVKYDLEDSWTTTPHEHGPLEEQPAAAERLPVPSEGEGEPERLIYQEWGE